MTQQHLPFPWPPTEYRQLGHLREIGAVSTDRGIYMVKPIAGYWWLGRLPGP